MLHPELPQNLEAEGGVIASVFINRDALIRIASWLKPEHFYRETNGWVYEAQLDCLRRRETPDIRNVMTALKKANRLDAVGGIEKLAEYTDLVPTSSAVESYAREVERCATLRRLVDAGARIAEIGFNAGKDAEAAMSEAQALLNGISFGGGADMLTPLEAIIDDYYTVLERVQTGEHSALGLQTGFRDIDDMTGGLHAEELTVLAARPSVGKSALMLSLAYNIARRCDADVLIFSLEMSQQSLMQRLLSMETRIDTHRLRTMRMGEQEHARVIEAMTELAGWCVYIADFAAMTAEQIRLGALRHMARYGRPILPIIDYLQLMGSTRRHENRVQDVSEISRGLKLLARSLHVPVIALSQLSRGVESRQDHVPMLSDLRDSGSIEQDADNVWFLYREELYDKDTDKKGIAELYIAKQRNGPIGVSPMRFDAATTRFDDLSYRTPDGY